MTGEDIKQRRAALQLTQEQLAEAFDVAPQTIAQWESGEVAVTAPGMARLAFFALETFGDLEKHAPELERLQQKATAKMAALTARMSQW